ncbi:hypothetical protein F0L68_14675 [Solihabitans fulvus]|uniref:Dynamin N-terminal domain-containing protein n=1 Tax=Solihabitans fulvus TaxID=1892852 RepID=A0A5B2XE21_9PSEU|nr:dynamin family protein [Solihabitans fulvus]KAA2261947.1 hypothetical protein F0L68_14675 [Solihabitans fulvus]
MTLDEAVWGALNEAAALYRGNPRATNWLGHQLERFAEPVRIAVAGQQKSGKSTLVNAIVGEQIAPIELSDGTQVPTWYRDGAPPRASLVTRNGAAQDVPVDRVDRRLRIDLRSWPPPQVERISVDWPSRALRGATLIDTPACPPSAAERLAREADAVLYLTRHLHGTDTQSLESLQHPPLASAGPVNAILVLSHADELGASRIDALSAAKRVARRYRADVQVSPLCQNVVAVAGLLAHTARTLREHEFGALSALAGTPRAALDGALLSADRFAGTDFPAAVSQEIRQELLNRFGVFGVRLAVTLIRTGCHNQAALTAELVQRSGLAELRESIGQCFTERREVLKARSALLALEDVLRMEPHPGAARLTAHLERVLASAHEFRELRLTAALQCGRTTLPDGLDLEAQRLLGAAGTGVHARLGVAEAATGSELRQLAVDVVDRWRVQAENPLFTARQRQAAATVVRSCEGMVARLVAERG